MCDSYSINTSADEIISEFEISSEQETIGEKYRLNRSVGPGDIAPVLIAKGEDRILRNYKWGIWNSKSQKYETIARIESIKTSPLWKDAIKDKDSRCIIPASSFFEWKVISEEEKVSVEIFHKSEELFAFAGIHMHYHENGKVIPGFAIITVPASLEMTPVGDHQPGTIAKDDFDAWLEGNADPISLIRSERGITFEIKSRIGSDS
ncbi:hypothetical protein LEP1GSC050_0473 [Leptospira broomii serovar Hurstbridge str. 5399]|uniref:Abasic site processing protein n=1 Tax=Leptospira broomii serovar Hurstbridge str. 5399 TaxID=1049789 RepID=T0F640_9LEPT|nr:SOS response-associated peptidase family protein [Leptospira broomii]EQA46560.1 hypothetical protein LEP1GSC050_0473 [Leptospira broomii serovar Hurstbridge str. 5399]